MFSEVLENMKFSWVLGQISKSKQFKQILNAIFTSLASKEGSECIKSLRQISWAGSVYMISAKVSNRVRKVLGKVTFATQNVFIVGCHS